MAQLNLKLAEITPEKVVVIDGKQYLILGENKSSTSESTPKKSKSGKRSVFTKEDKQKRRDAIMTIVRDNPGLNKQEIIAELEKRFNLVVTSSMWNNTQIALKNDGHLRSEWINDKQPWEGARYYAVSSNASENLDNEDSWGSGESDLEEELRTTSYEHLKALREAGFSNIEIAVRLGLNEAEVRKILDPTFRPED